jgi:hypothetical protein
VAIYRVSLFHAPASGQICCDEHAPTWIEGNAWARDRWQRVTMQDREEWTVAELGEIRSVT